MLRLAVSWMRMTASMALESAFSNRQYKSYALINPSSFPSAMTDRLMELRSQYRLFSVSTTSKMSFPVFTTLS